MINVKNLILGGILLIFMVTIAEGITEVSLATEQI